MIRFLINRRDIITADLIAGVTVAMVAIPQSLAYAQLAGVPPIHGLYAAFIPTIVGALFGSSKLLSTGPVAMTSLLTAASLAPLAAQGSDLFNSYVILLALLSGLFQLAFGILRMGVLLNFLSHPVLWGFINAAAIIIALSQLPTMLDLAAPNTGHFLLDILQMFGNLGATHVRSLCFGVASIGALILFKQKMPKFPGILVTVAVTTMISYGIGFEPSGGQVVGTVPQGLPTFNLPPLDWKGSVALLPASFVVALVSFMEAMSSAKIIAIRTREPWNENRELIGQGLAKIASAFCNSMPVSGSFSRSALNLAANARTAFSSVVSALFVVLTLLVLTPLLHHLPKAVLAAIIIMAVANLLNVRSLRNAWRANIDDGYAGLITFGATLIFAPNIQFGILTGILLSLALLLYRIMRPSAVVLGLADGALHALNDAHRDNIAPLGPRLGALRFDRALLFVNVSYFEDALLELERANPNLTHILIKCNGINHLDASGVEMLLNQIARFKLMGITIAFSSLKQQVYEVMMRTGLVREIGAQNIFASDREALEGLRPHWDGEQSVEHSKTHARRHLLPAPKIAIKPSIPVPAPFKSGAARVLVPLDTSAATLRAVDVAILMVKNVDGGKVILLNTQSPTTAYTGAVNSGATDGAGQQELRRAIAVCEKSGVTFEICNAPGKFVETTVRIADEQTADHIVMTTAGTRSVLDRLRRSQATRVAERVQVPVTIIK